MSFLSDIAGIGAKAIGGGGGSSGGGGILDTVSSFIGNNQGWLKPVLSTVTGAIRQTNTDNSQQDYLNYLRQREDQNYQNSLAQINAYNAALSAGGGGGSSGGGGGNGAAVAAAKATEANRMKAAKKANQYTKTMYSKLLDMYAPYKQTADALLPQMTKTYQDSLGLQSALNQYVQRPDQVAKLNASVPAYAINIPLPDSVRIK